MVTQKKSGEQLLEGIVVAAIFLVLIQTFLEDFAKLMAWNWSFRRVLVITGFGFDLFFSIEFLTRLYNSMLRRDVRAYLLERGGWIDFLASVPLLVLNSGPSVIALAAGSVGFAGMGGFLNVLKVTKTIRIARILRLLRVLKIAKNIRFIDSTMAQRHISRIGTMIVAGIVFTVMGLSIISVFIPITDPNSALETRAGGIVKVLDEVNLNEEQGKKLVDESIELVPEILLIQENNRTVYQRYTQEQIAKRFGPGDYALISGDTISVYISTQALNAQDARTTLNIFVIILVVLFILTFVYGPHFALTISDPVAIMRRGMDDPTYTLEVSIPKIYENDEIYRLADSYNEEFLPMKSRQEMGGGAQSRLADLDFDSLLGDQLDEQESIDSLNEDED